MKILVVSQMWPSASDPDFGAFLVPHVDALRAIGNEVEVVAIEGRGGSRLKYPALTARAVFAAARFRPDVVLAHMLFPAGAAGLVAARAARAPLVVMAHGQDVANLEDPKLLRATRKVVERATVVANSAWLARELRRHLPGTTAHVLDLGVDLEQFNPISVTAAADWPGQHPRLLCVGSLTERKNVIALADAFTALGEGSLVFVGDGPLRGELEARDGVSVTGRLPHRDVPSWMAASDVLCQPSLVEPFGIAALEAMALERTVLVSAVGGAAEFVSAEAGVVCNPGDPDDLGSGLARAIALGSPNPAARAIAEAHGVEVQARRFEDVLRAASRRR